MYIIYGMFYILLVKSLKDFYKINICGFKSSFFIYQIKKNLKIKKSFMKKILDLSVFKYLFN